MTVPSIHRWMAGDEFNAERMNEIRDWVDWMRNPPMVHVRRRLTNQTLTQGGGTNWVTIEFDQLVNSYDPYGMWDAGTVDRITCQVPGWYTVEGCINLQHTATDGRTMLGVYRNGTGEDELYLRHDQQNAPGGTNPCIRKETMIFMNIGDWLHLRVWYDTDVNRVSVAGSDSQSSQLRARWVAQ